MATCRIPWHWSALGLTWDEYMLFAKDTEQPHQWQHHLHFINLTYTPLKELIRRPNTAPFSGNHYIHAFPTEWCQCMYFIDWNIHIVSVVFLSLEISTTEANISKHQDHLHSCHSRKKGQYFNLQLTDIWLSRVSEPRQHYLIANQPGYYVDTGRLAT